MDQNETFRIGRKLVWLGNQTKHTYINQSCFPWILIIFLFIHINISKETQNWLMLIPQPHILISCNPPIFLIMSAIWLVVGTVGFTNVYPSPTVQQNTSQFTSFKPFYYSCFKRMSLNMILCPKPVEVEGRLVKILVNIIHVASSLAGERLS